MEENNRNIFDDAVPAKGDLARFFEKAEKAGLVDAPEPRYKHGFRTAFTIIAANFACAAAVVLFFYIIEWNSTSDTDVTASDVNVVAAIDYFKGMENEVDLSVIRDRFTAAANEICSNFDNYDPREVARFSSSVMDEAVPFETTLPLELDDIETAMLIKRYYNGKLNALNEISVAIEAEDGSNR